jgi:hypothetical protein
MTSMQEVTRKLKDLRDRPVRYIEGDIKVSEKMKEYWEIYSKVRAAVIGQEKNPFRDVGRYTREFLNQFKDIQQKAMTASGHSKCITRSQMSKMVASLDEVARGVENEVGAAKPKAPAALVQTQWHPGDGTTASAKIVGNQVVITTWEGTLLAPLSAVTARRGVFMTAITDTRRQRRTAYTLAGSGQTRMEWFGHIQGRFGVLRRPKKRRCLISFARTTGRLQVSHNAGVLYGT